LPSQSDLKAALTSVVTAGANGGLSNQMWATIVNRDGVVCAVAFSGPDRGTQWPGSRVISAQKANTANAFSLPRNFGGAIPGLALSTANLYSAVQDGGSLFGLQFSNPVDTGVAYKGPSTNYGKPNDPMLGNKIGGVNVFGGGLGLYTSQGPLVGGLGVSGDTSCTDHNVAWKVRRLLNLDYVPNGVSSNGDNIIYDITTDAFGHKSSASGFGHPTCDATATAVAATLPQVRPLP
jgi:uncharacterized protein GlcG (DUF336 family)